MKNDSWRHVIEDCLKVDAHNVQSVDEILQRDCFISISILCRESSCRLSELS